MKGSELRIKAKKLSGTLELIPHEKLTGDFPTLLVQEHAHWLQLNSGAVEFRPLSRQWKESAENWTMQLHNASTASILPARMSTRSSRGKTYLCDVRSSTAVMLSRQLLPLEVPKYLHVHYTPLKSPAVEVELPRYRLSFAINTAYQMECQSIRNMVIDEVQSVGTLIGLKNQLVLRARDQRMQCLPQYRLVLIPRGTVAFWPNSYHTSVEIQNGGDRSIAYHQYWVDQTLGRLTGTADLASRLYKIYLHAVTSHCLPDPLTRRTGTEEALDELTSGASMSFQTMTSDNATLLQQISCLAPRHEYYPEGMRCMQTIDWSSLPPLAQHYGFHTAAQSILEYACSLRLFQSADTNLSRYLEPRHGPLQLRSAERASKLYPDDVGINLPGLSFPCSDVEYTSRDRTPEGAAQEESEAFRAASFVDSQWGRPIYVSLNILSQLEEWKCISGPSEDSRLKYSSSWITNPNLPDNWLSLYNICRLHKEEGLRYKMIFSLSSMAFTNAPLRKLVPVLAAFATHATLRNIKPPGSFSYDLSKGYKPEKATIRGYVDDAAHALYESPSGSLTRTQHETDYAFWNRQTNDYKKNIKKNGECMTQHIMSHLTSRPYTILADLPRHFSIWYDLGTCLTKVNEYISSCRDNKQLREHIDCVQSVLSASSPTLGSSAAIASEPVMSFTPAQRLNQPGQPIPNLSNLMVFSGSPAVDEPLPPHRLDGGSRHPIKLSNMALLENIFNNLCYDTEHPIRRRFGRDLSVSYEDLLQREPSPGIGLLPTIDTLETYRHASEIRMKQSYDAIQSCLNPGEFQHANNVLYISGLWPRLMHRTLLSQLSYVYRSTLTPRAKEALAVHGRAILTYQRAQRLLEAAHRQQVEDFFKELDNTYLTHGLTDADLDELLIEVRPEIICIIRVLKLFLL
jgi:hypothetical protein